MLAILGVLIFLLSLADTAWDDFKYKRAEKKREADDKPKEKKPNIFIEFIKAKKEKVCPIIEFEDED